MMRKSTLTLPNRQMNFCQYVSYIVLWVIVIT